MISSLDGTAIKSVDIHFGVYYEGDHAGKMSVNAGVLSEVTITDPEADQAEATIMNVNATSVTLSSSAIGPSIDEVTVYFDVKAANPLEASAVKATQTLTYKNSLQSFNSAEVFKVSGAQGAVSFSKKSGDAAIKVNADGKVVVGKGLAAGTYKVVFAVTAAGNASYEAATKDVAVTFLINKAVNPLAVRPLTRSLKVTKVVKKNVTIPRPMKITDHKGTLKYAKVKSGSSKYLNVISNIGKVTVKKGTPKGVYEIKIKVTAAGNKNYKSRSKTVTCKVKVV